MRKSAKTILRDKVAPRLAAIRASFEAWAQKEFAGVLDGAGNEVLGACDGAPWNRLTRGKYANPIVQTAWKSWHESVTTDGNGSPRLHVGETEATGYLTRFVDALEILCAARPDVAMCEQWLRHEPGSERLQDWVVDHTRANWGTGIGTIEAAEVMAENPEEGVNHEGFRNDFRPEECEA